MKSIWELIIALVLIHYMVDALKPNIILVLTDDQDIVLNGMNPMERTKQLIGKAGATFTNAFTSSPICCPSRASVMSGLYSHNHRTHNNSISGNCYGDHWRTVIEPHSLAAILQKFGDYRTFFAGKYLNQYYGDHIPPGWTEFHGLHGNSRYYNYTLRQNDRNVSYTDEYFTDVLQNLILQFLDEHHKHHAEMKLPFFAMIAPPASHAPYTPAERHRGKFSGVKVPRTPNFNNIAGPFEKHWLVAATKTILNATLDRMDMYFEQRWETLLAVDELVDSMITKLNDLNQLDNTYIVYTSDNGYHIGQFAQPYDKRQPYETDIRVPLLMRGPHIPHGITISTPALLLDLMPTILEWAQVVYTPPSKPFDGISLQSFFKSTNSMRTNLLVEYWGEGNTNTYNPECPWKPDDRLAGCDIDADCHCQDAWNNTYSCIRHLQYDLNYLYCEFHDEENFVEMYDLANDKFQLHNNVYDMLPIERALRSLALDKLKRCSGTECHQIQSYNH